LRPPRAPAPARQPCSATQAPLLAAGAGRPATAGPCPPLPDRRASQIRPGPLATRVATAEAYMSTQRQQADGGGPWPPAPKRFDRRACARRRKARAGAPPDLEVYTSHAPPWIGKSRVVVVEHKAWNPEGHKRGDLRCGSRGQRGCAGRFAVWGRKMGPGKRARAPRGRGPLPGAPPPAAAELRRRRRAGEGRARRDGGCGSRSVRANAWQAGRGRHGRPRKGRGRRGAGRAGGACWVVLGCAL
jgi:hypothetical protein